MDRINLFSELPQSSASSAWIDTIGWNPLGYSWYYYINSGDYKLEDWGETVRLNILVAGLEKEDIEAFLEGTHISVSTKKPGWNGNVSIDVDLSGYKIDTKQPSVKLANGVLLIEFPKIGKEKLEIK